jgi:peptidoglycan/xylan/chitin deacetylase (PgdA/CDA1 family)
LKFITTSWDDGHVLDFKLAELLAKYNLPGTFYIPKENVERPVMTEQQVIELSKAFEVGGHTLGHTRLNNRQQLFLQSEVGGSFHWLNNLLGFPPDSFCFPGGVFTKEAMAVVFGCGYKVARTTELLTTRGTTPGQLTPTTLQVYDHAKLTYIKHLLKRGRVINLVRFMQIPVKKNLEGLTEYYLNVMNEGACFHLWGHSWEIEEHGLWQKFENLLKRISGLPDFTYIENRHVLSNPFKP